MAIKFDTFKTGGGSAPTGGLVYKGPYNATTQSPNLSTALKGDFYIVDVQGTLAGVQLNVGDHIVFSQNASSPITSAMFDVIDNTDAVASVNSQTGVVVLDSDNIAEGSSNQYFTSARFTSEFNTKDTDSLTEGSNNLYYTNSRFDTQLGTKTTTDLAEGSNLYHTNARVDARIALATANDLSDVSYTADASIDGYVMKYNNTSGNWEAQAESAGGVTSVNGDSGPAVVLTTTNVNEGTNLYYTDARFDTRLATKTTTDLAEGSNLYHTNARVDARIALATANDLSDVSYTAGAPIDGYVMKYNNTSGNWEAAADSTGVTSVNGDSGPTVVLTTTNVNEGTNLYYTDARFDTRLATKTTTNLTEGSNLYHTNARVDARIALATANDLSDVSYTADASIDGYVMKYNNTSGNWEAQAASGGGFTYDGTQGAASFNAVLSYHYAINTSGASANITMTLPAASSGGSEIRVKLLDATHSVIVAVQTGETLDTTTNGTTTLSVANQSITLVDNGSTGWEIV